MICMINYITHDHRRNKEGVESGFVAAITIYGSVSYLNGNKSPFPDSGMYVKTVYIDKSGYGTVEFKIPKSLYDKLLVERFIIAFHIPIEKTLK